MNERERKMSLLHGAAMGILKSMLWAVSTSFEVSGEEHKRWRCFPIVVSYCFDIPEVKRMSCIEHSTSVQKPFVASTASMRNIQNLNCRPKPVSIQGRRERKKDGRKS